jgi:DNA-binding beta-propeller fold protein YncE
MFILGDGDNDVTEYTLDTGFDISDNLTEIDDGDIITTPLGMAFNTDGTKMFIVGNADDTVLEYSLGTGFDISDNLTLEAGGCDVSAQDTTPRGIAFNTDGTKMFIVGKVGKDVNEYEIDAFDVSTCQFQDAFSVITQENAPSGIAFNTDGTKMFVLGDGGNDVNEYACSTGFDVSTCHGADDKDISGQEANALAMAFNSDGTKMFIGGFAGDDVNEYTLSTAYDVSTATFVDAFSISTHEGKITGLAFDTNGHRMFIVGQDGVEMNEYYLTVAWDVSTASHK